MLGSSTKRRIWGCERSIKGGGGSFSSLRKGPHLPIISREGKSVEARDPEALHGRSFRLKKGKERLNLYFKKKEKKSCSDPLRREKGDRPRRDGFYPAGGGGGMRLFPH